MEQTVDMQEDGWVYFKASPRGETRKHTQKKQNKTSRQPQAIVLLHYSKVHLWCLTLPVYVLTISCVCACVRVCVSLLFFYPLACV